MGLEQYMVVLLVHHLLLFVLDLSTKNNMHLRKGRKYNRNEFINQCHVWLEENQTLVEAVTTVSTKNVPVSGSKRKQLDLIQQFINVRSAL